MFEVYRLLAVTYKSHLRKEEPIPKIHGPCLLSWEMQITRQRHCFFSVQVVSNHPEIYIAMVTKSRS